jgi:hypothetical protein
MKLESFSNGPQFYLAPLVSAEQAWVAKIVREIASSAFEWICSIFRFVFRVENPVEPVSLRTKILQTGRQLEALKRSRPGFLGNLSFRGVIKQYFHQITLPLGIASIKFIWNRSKEDFFIVFKTATSAFIAKKIVDITSNVFAETVSPFFPSTSYATKKIAGLILCGPAVWNAAGTLGYEQGYMFLIGVFSSTFPFCLQIFNQHRARNQRELERQQFAK